MKKLFTFLIALMSTLMATSQEFVYFYDFTVDDFKLEGYEASPLKEKLEVAV